MSHHMRTHFPQDNSSALEPQNGSTTFPSVTAALTALEKTVNEINECYWASDAAGFRQILDDAQEALDYLKVGA